jgi:release factor glutamine methyltransferase
MKAIVNLLRDSIVELRKEGLEDARISAEILLAHCLKCKRMDLYLRFDQPLEEQEILQFRGLLERRKKREPIAYLCQSVPFYHTEIEVNSDVLIPRPETELLVEKVVQILRKQDLKGKLLLDLCCGSGCMAVAIKKEFPQLQVVARDISLPALEVAKRNAKKNGTEIEFQMADLLEGFPFKMDFLLCNPPYVAEEEMPFLEEDVKCYEPSLALVAKSSGFEFYERIAKSLATYLNPKAKIFFEMGSTQKKRLEQLFSQSFWTKREFFLDASGKDRFFFLENE